MFDSKVNIFCFCAAMFEGIIVHNDDEIILNANHALVTMTGYEVRKLIGKNSLVSCHTRITRVNQKKYS